MPSSKQGQSSITIRCTADEHDLITSKAKSYGISTSEYVRLVCINAQILVKVKALN